MLTGTAKDELEKEDTYGIWSEDTVELYKLSDAEDDAGFKDFFTAFENFRELQNSDVSPVSCFPNGSCFSCRIQFKLLNKNRETIQPLPDQSHRTESAHTRLRCASLTTMLHLRPGAMTVSG